jgi:hypothetical protein
MGKVVELPEETYDQLRELAQQHHCAVEEMVRRRVQAYEQAQYDRVHAQMLADGLLVVPAALDERVTEDFDPEVLPGTPVSDLILDERR